MDGVGAAVGEVALAAGFKTVEAPDFGSGAAVGMSLSPVSLTSGSSLSSSPFKFVVEPDAATLAPRPLCTKPLLIAFRPVTVELAGTRLSRVVDFGFAEASPVEPVAAVGVAGVASTLLGVEGAGGLVTDVVGDAAGALTGVWAKTLGAGLLASG